jgi:DNA-binding PadR family transcriptional regulator
LSEKKRLSAEYTMLSILEYLCINSQSGPLSKYHILTKISVIRQQRHDRISQILNNLEENGYIESTKTSDSTSYKITEKGYEIYHKWVKDFLDFVRSM